MNTSMDAEPNDDPATEGATAADTPPDTESAEGEDEAEEFTHLDSLSDGAGCAEVWEHLSETRDED